MSCINRNSKEFKELVEMSGLTSPLVEIYTLSHQKKFCTDAFPTLNQINRLPKKLNKLIDPSLDTFIKESNKLKMEELSDSIVEENLIVNKVFNDNMNGIKSSKDILNNILTNVEELSDESLLIIKALLPNTSSIIRFRNISEDNVPMMYNPANNEIIIDKSKFKNTDITLDFVISTIMHEVIHEFTHKALSKPTSINEKIFNSSVEEVYSEYKNFYLKDGSGKFDIAFSSKDEFVSELLTDPSFVKELRDLEKDNTIWDKLLSAFRSLFGIKKSNKLDELINDFIIFSSTFSYEDFGNRNIYKKTTKKSKKKLSELTLKLETTQDKYENVAEHILLSLESNIRSFNKSAKIVSYKDEKRGSKIKDYATKLETVKESVEKYKDTNIALALTTYAESMSNALDVINARFKTIDYDNIEEAYNTYDIYNNYLTTYSVSKNIKKELCLKIKKVKCPKRS